MANRYGTWASIACIVSALAAPLASSAQLAMMSRTPELERLGVFVGSWQRSAAPKPPTARAPVGAHMVATWNPGDLWMAWDATIRFSTGEIIYGRRQIAWDSDEGVYRCSWIDTQSAHINKCTARWSDTGALVFEGEPFTWRDGRSYRFKMRYEIASPTEIHEIGWRSIDGGPYEQHSMATWAKDNG